MSVINKEHFFQQKWLLTSVARSYSVLDEFNKSFKEITKQTTNEHLIISVASGDLLRFINKKIPGGKNEIQN